MFGDLTYKLGQMATDKPCINILFCDMWLDLVFELKHLCFLPPGSCIKDPGFSGSCVKDSGCWSHDCLVSMTMSPTHCDIM